MIEISTAANIGFVLCIFVGLLVETRIADPLRWRVRELETELAKAYAALWEVRDELDRIQGDPDGLGLVELLDEDET